MTLWSRLVSWMHAILRRSRMENEMDAEQRFHIETYAEDLIRGGVARSEARPDRVWRNRAKEECRDARGPNLVGKPHPEFALRLANGA